MVFFLYMGVVIEVLGRRVMPCGDVKRNREEEIWWLAVSRVVVSCSSESLNRFWFLLFGIGN